MASAMTVDQAKGALQKVSGWQMRPDGKMIYRDYVTRDFVAAIDFINRIMKIAEAENHHPDLHLTGYRKLRIELTTHDAGGLSENDFKEAALINALPVALKS